jgi:hypothetical protein
MVAALDKQRVSLLLLQAPFGMDVLTKLVAPQEVIQLYRYSPGFFSDNRLLNKVTHMPPLQCRCRATVT